ncbi:MAG: DUF4013 domain-containing protein [Methanobrevibacter sp.]|uniref:DUF4013 domain-containing protein n=1 Tax=Methanobrevibacter sp. TaxID=66852 RepID=UPI0026E0910D|nr:DUF4013 domain-containing protein [Methanobrevibacter sp.]MDO5847996.1 DUF4013 domain-containing protein [Methanobrevibacter sp.]
MILDIYKDSFEYAGQNIKVLLKLGLLSIFSFLIIPIFLIAGYQYRVIESGTKGMVGGEDKLPEFDNFTGMFVDGLKMIIVQFIYLFIPIVVFIIIGTIGQTINNDAISSLGAIIGIILFIISVFYSFLAVPNMIANEGSLKAAFDFKRINEIIKMIGVGRFIITFIGLMLLCVVISAVVAAILIGIFGVFGIAIGSFNPAAFGGVMIGGLIIYEAIFSFIVTPYLGIFSSRVTGLIYGLGE